METVVKQKKKNTSKSKSREACEYQNIFKGTRNSSLSNLRTFVLTIFQMTQLKTIRCSL